MQTGIIGLGPHGKRLHKVVERMPELELVALVDSNQEALVFEGVESNVKYANTENMYAQERIDLLIIATNGPSHHPLAVEAMQNGVTHLLIEKPMACSVEECQSIEAIAAEKGVRLSVDKKNRHDPVLQYI